MKQVLGNINAIIEKKTSAKNELGEVINTFTTLMTVSGFLDYNGGESSENIYNAKVADSTHIFICDYVELPKENQLRMIINGEIYEIKLIDNPMGKNYHLEIFLKYVGIQ